MNDTTAVLPARMVNEFVYCPRLFALEHIDGEWAESADTVRGSTVHRRVDRATAVGLPAPEACVSGDADSRPAVIRSVHLTDGALGITAKVDLVEVKGNRAVPVDYKKGRVPDVPERAWPPERVQICVQALLLRAHGYTCEVGILYFAGSRRRVEVRITDALVDQTLAAIGGAREVMRAGILPPPLVDSPKCRRCSLVGICLPDETNVLRGATRTVRPLVPGRSHGVPLYVEARGAKLARSGGEIVVKVEGKVVNRVRISDTTRVAVTGAASVTTPLLHTLLDRHVPVSIHAPSGRLVGTMQPAGGTNVLARIAQHRVAADPGPALALARRFVHGKIHNQRVMLRRNGVDVPGRVLDLLRHHAERSTKSADLSSLYGTEGIAARVYFENFTRMIKRDGVAAFAFESRTRRPPRDPINALLSFAYAILHRECVDAVTHVGLDAWVGFLHRPRPGKAALALDLMEEFRAIVADSAVLTAVNTGVVGASDFAVHRAGTQIKGGARRRFIRALERRLAEEVTHPVFGTRMSYRRVLEVQARLVAKTVRGDIDEYPAFKVR